MKLVEQVFTEVLSADGAAREDLLRSRCLGDSQLMNEVRMLLECATEASGVLDHSAPDMVDLPRIEEDPSLLPSGTKIGPYVIRTVLGIGGMGVVYVGEQSRPKRTVALKVIRPGFATPSVLKRFEYEAELLGRLQHPGIAQIIEAGAAQTAFGVQPFFAMELVDGKSLTMYATERGLSVRKKIELVIKVCDAVEHAHQRGVVHRDLKPNNILVDASGQPKILDFGVARATGGREGEQRLTLMRTGERQLVGTLAYMSPEQISGDHAAVDTRSDVYTVGVILFELLAGVGPHDLEKRSLPDAVRVIRDEDPKRLGKLVPACRGDLDVICAKALEKRPDDRYHAAAELAADLRRTLDDVPIEAKPHSAIYHVRKFARRNKGLVAGMMVACAAVVGGAAFGAVQYSRAVSARNLAEDRAKEASLATQQAISERDAKEKEKANLQRTLAFVQANVFSLAYETYGDAGRAVSIVDALKLAQRNMAQGFGDDHLSEARLRFYSSLILMSNNEFDTALIASRRATELFAGLGEASELERIAAEQHLIALLVRVGRTDEAQRVGSELGVRVGKSGPPGTNVLAAQALAWMETGRFEKAEPLLHQQLNIVIPQKNITPLNLYVQTRRLGAILGATGKLDEMQRLWDERIAACTAYFPGGDATAQTSQFLAGCADQLEEVGEYKRALPYRRRVHAVSIPELWMTRSLDAPFLLAANLRAIGDPAATVEACELTGALLTRAQTTLGVRALPLHRTAASHIRSLLAAGRIEEAMSLASESMATLHYESGDWTYRISEVRQAAGEAMLAGGRFAEACELARAEYQRRARVRGLTSVQAIESLRLLGGALTKAGRANEVGLVCRQAVDAQLELGSMASSATLTLVQACGEVMLDAGDAAGAEGLARRSLAEQLADPGTLRKPVIELHVLLAKAVAKGRGNAAAHAEFEGFAAEAIGVLGELHPWMKSVREELNLIRGSR